MIASFEQATGIIRQLREGNERLQAEPDLLRAVSSMGLIWAVSSMGLIWAV